jgi:hypothetical protein
VVVARPRIEKTLERFRFHHNSGLVFSPTLFLAVAGEFAFRAFALSGGDNPRGFEAFERFAGNQLLGQCANRFPMCFHDGSCLAS